MTAKETLSSTIRNLLLGTSVLFLLLHELLLLNSIRRRQRFLQNLLFLGRQQSRQLAVKLRLFDTHLLESALEKTIGFH